MKPGVALGVVALASVTARRHQRRTIDGALVVEGE